MSIKPHDYGCWGGKGNNVFTIEDLEKQSTEAAKIISSSAKSKNCTGKIARFALGLFFGLGLVLSIITFIAAAVTLPLGVITILILVTQVAFAVTLGFKLYRLVTGKQTQQLFCCA